MAIVLAHKNGEADWPTTKAALLAFSYAKDPEEPAVGDPGYGGWYNSDPGVQPNSHDELLAAAENGAMERDRVHEVTEALYAARSEA